MNPVPNPRWPFIINIVLLAITVLAISRLGTGLTIRHSVTISYNGLTWNTETNAKDVAELLLAQWGSYEGLDINPSPETQLTDAMTVTITGKETQALDPTVATNLKLKQAQLAKDAQAAAKPKSPIYSGLATWYRFGDKLTAASRRYPEGTKVRVVAINSGKTVDVTINDYGPSVFTGIDLDLNEPAFAQIAPLGAGKIKVKYYKI